MSNIKICKYYQHPQKCINKKGCGNQLLSNKNHCCSDLYYSMALEEENKKYKQVLNEVEGLVKNFCEDCSEYECCDYEKDGCYYSILPRLKDIINKVKE